MKTKTMDHKALAGSDRVLEVKNVTKTYGLKGSETQAFKGHQF